MIKLRHDSAPGQCIAPQTSGVDGYIRLRQRDLTFVQLVHVFTLRDAAVLSAVAHGAISAGLTEWAGRLDGCPAEISIGWDWYRDRHNRIRLAGSDIRSNLMLIGVSGSDWGMKRTEQALRRWLGLYDWAQAIAISANEFLH